jgi:sugar phosphate isomerase/epimerase
MEFTAETVWPFSLMPVPPDVDRVRLMQPNVTRRNFLRSTLAATALAGLGARAAEPFQRSAPARLQLSLAAYSFRDFFKHSDHERKQQTPADKRIDMFQFVDYCASQDCAGAELTSYYFPPDANSASMLGLRRHCFLRGVEVSGGAVGNTFTHPPGEKRDAELRHVKKWIDLYAALGAPHIRVFAGNAPKGVSRDEALKHCIAGLEECADHAGKRGIFLGIENHGGIVAEADQLLEILRTVKSPWVGINLDSANFHTDDPYRDFERCVPFAVNVQMKSEIQRRGQKQEAADMLRLTKILKAANYRGYVALEYEAAEDAWVAVPRLLKQMSAAFAG